MFQDLTIFKVPSGFRGKSVVSVQLWRIAQSTLFRFSPQYFNSWRRFLLRLFGAKIGKNVLIRPTVKILYPWKLTINNYSWIGSNVTIYNMASVVIGDNCVISQKSYLCAGTHDYNKPTFDIYSKPIIIENEVWITSDVFIAPGIKIGYGSVVGFRSTVTKDLPPKMICIGNPAKPIKPR